jgi:uncharacterized protein YkwD
MKKILIILIPITLHGQVDNSAIQTEFIKLLNSYRKLNGVPTVKPHLDAQAAAKIQSDYLASTFHTEGEEYKYEITHFHPTYPHPQDRVNFINPILSQNFAVGENAAEFFRDSPVLPKEIAEQLFEQWKHSPGHNALMLEPGFSHIGIAVSSKKQTITYVNKEYNVTHQSNKIMYASALVFLMPMTPTAMTTKF